MASRIAIAKGMRSLLSECYQMQKGEIPAMHYTQHKYDYGVFLDFISDNITAVDN